MESFDDALEPIMELLLKLLQGAQAGVSGEVDPERRTAGLAAAERLTEDYEPAARALVAWAAVGGTLLTDLIRTEREVISAVGDSRASFTVDVPGDDFDDQIH